MTRRLSAERENVVIAAERALAQRPVTRDSTETALRALLGLDPIVIAFGPLEPHLALLDRALAAATEASVGPLLRAAALTARGRLRRRQGLLAEGCADHREAAAIAHRESDPALEGLALSRLSSALQSQGHIDDALAAAALALALHRAAGDEAEEAVTLSNVGAFLEEQGRLADAHGYYTEALALHRRVGNRRYEAITLANMAVGYGDGGRGVEARDCAAQALAFGRELGDCMIITSAGYTLALLDAIEGRVDRAAAGFEDALAAAQQNGNRRWEGIHLGFLGAICVEQRSPRQARERLDDAAVSLRAAGDARYGALTAGFRAGLELADGRIEQADALLDAAAAQLASRANDPLVVAIRLLRAPVELAKARRAMARGDDASAAAHRAAAHSSLDSAGVPTGDSRHGNPLARTPWTLDVQFAFGLARRALDADDATRAPDRRWLSPGTRSASADRSGRRARGVSASPALACSNHPYRRPRLAVSIIRLESPGACMGNDRGRRVARGAEFGRLCDQIEY